MKLIYKTLVSLLPMCAMLMSCEDEKPFSVAGSGDEPHILDPIFPNRVNDELPVVATITRDANFMMDLTVTPSEYVNVTWYLDGEEVATGKSINKSLLAGQYEMKVVVTTIQGKSTSREGIVQVNPLDGDPSTFDVGFERLIAPGTQARIYGNNLANVQALKIGESSVSEMTVATDDSGGNQYISYTVPTGIEDGRYRVILTDTDGMEYGGGIVTVTSSSLITEGFDRIAANATWKMTGINLDKVTSLKIGDATVSDFSAQNATSIQLVCPALSDGEYVLSGQMSDGREVTFYSNKQAVTEVHVVISSEQTLWSGHHYVSWDLPDDNPNKKFGLIGKDVFAGIKAGAVMSVHYSLNPADEYHQIRTTTGWWNDLPGTGTVEAVADGIVEVLLTQEALDMIQTQEGFLCVGHGYYVDLVTIK